MMDRVHPVVVVCLVLLLVGAVLALRWGHLGLEAPPPAERPTFAGQARRGLWYLDMLLIGGVVAGVLVAGAGGRLAMRLLAVTGGDRAQGRITEADEVVGEITVGGTIGFLIFGGLFAGVVTAAIYTLLAKWLPTGWWGALAFAALLLTTLAVRIEPLRSDNPDFDIVGPDALAVSVFAALTVLHAIVLVAVMARVSRSLPLLRKRPRVVLAYSPLLLLVPTTAVGAAAVLVMLAGAAVSTNPAVRHLWAHPRVLLAGRLLIATVVLLSLPAFITTLADIL
jgi:hypothetical protein